jgi:hypothetical protein
MTINIAEDCSSIEITSEILLSNNLENKLLVTYNGNTTEIEMPLSITIYEITPDQLDMAAKFSDGVYTLKLQCTLNSGSIQEDQRCAVMLCAFTCSDEMFAMYSEKDLDKILIFQALKTGKECSTCSCANLENLYTKLTENDSNSCGTCCCSM